MTGAPTHPRPAAGTVILRGESVLLIQRLNPPRAGEWSIPGGKQEWGETIHETAVREAFEETGLHVTLGPLIDVLDAIFPDENGGPGFHYTLVDFLCLQATGTPRVGADVADVRFVPRAELPAYNLWPETLRIIEQGFALADAAP